MSILRYEGIPCPVAIGSVEDYMKLGAHQGYQGLSGIIHAGGFLSASVEPARLALTNPETRSANIEIFGEGIINFIENPEVTHLISVLSDTSSKLTEEQFMAMLHHEAGHIKNRHFERDPKEFGFVEIDGNKFLFDQAAEIEADNYAMEMTSPLALHTALNTVFLETAKLVGRLTRNRQFEEMHLDVILQSPIIAARFKNITSKM